MTESMRLQKFLSRAGVASRREAEALMREGRVRINGIRMSTPGASVNPSVDRVEVDGREVSLVRTEWVALNKPRGYLTTRTDPDGRRTVYDLLPPALHHLRYVGRLDRDTDGLLLLTNAGDALHALTHPSSEIVRRYLARVDGVPTATTLTRLSEGIMLEDGMARFSEAALVREIRDGGALLRLGIREGRKREVRRALEAAGHPVRRLRRITFGPLSLGPLEPGTWRPLTDEEVTALLAAVPKPNAKRATRRATQRRRPR
jgi:23S rRNA pseudouridine2605 synthase